MTDQPAMTETSSRPDDTILLFETSPYGNIDAIVQHDGRTVYFYLNSPPRDDQPSKFGTRALWVRNLQTGPYVLNTDDMKSGAAPMLPRTHCKFPHPSLLPCLENLKIVWFEEGNGAALVEKSADGSQHTIAVIPPWSGVDGFWGYAAECAAENELCWPLPDNPNLQTRIDRSEEFWTSFATKPDPFVTWQPELLASYQQHFESKTVHYFSIDGDKFPPRGLVHLKTDQHHILATVAMSLCSQPVVEMVTETPSQFRRIELAIQLPLDTSEETIETISKTISRLAAYPWQQINWFGHGHTVQFSGLIPGVETATLVSDGELHPKNPLPLPTFRNDQVNLLWITAGD
jgi:hypothetical protein